MNHQTSNSTSLSEMRDHMCNFAEEFCNRYTVDTSVESLRICLRDKLFDLLETFVPSKMVQNNYHQPWINRNI